MGKGESTVTPKSKPRAKSIKPTKLAKIANTIYGYYRNLLPNLIPRHDQRLRVCTRAWYNRVYHTGYKVSREDLLTMRHAQEINGLLIKNGEGEETENMKKALCH